MGMMQQMFASFQTTAGAPGVTTDALFAYVSLLLNGDNTAAPFNTDISTNSFVVSPVATVRNDTFNPFRTDGYYSNYFNGSTDYVVPPTIATFGTSYTIEAWINTSNVTSGTIFIASVANVANFAYIGLSVSSGTLSFSERATTGGANPSISGGTIVANTWYHVAVSVNSNSAMLFLNGTQVGSTTAVTAPTPTLTYTAIGAINNGIGAPVYYSGYISNVRVTNTAVYTSAFTPPIAPLTAITNTSLLTCQSSRFKDNSTNAYAITLGGTPAVKPAIPFSYADTSGSAYMNGATSGQSSMSIANDASLQAGASAVTIEAWVYPILPNLAGHDVGNNMIYYDCDSGTNNGSLGFLINASNQVTVGWYTSTTTASFASSTATVVPNSWNHVAISKVAASAATYICVNGVVSLVSTLATILAGSTPTIGQMGGYNANPGAGYRQFSGYMSNFRYVKGTALYTGSTYTVPTAPLTAITNTSLLTLQNSAPANNKGVIDSSINSMFITPTGAPSQGTFSPFSQTGWSGYFNGTTDYLTTPANTALIPGTTSTPFTLETWIYPTNFATGGGIICCSWPGTGQPIPYALYFGSSVGATDTSGKLVFSSYSGSAYTGGIVTPSAVTLNTWTHVAAVFNGTTMSIYLNGTLAVSGAGTVTSGGSNTVYIGHRWDSSTLIYYSGYISNTRIVIGTAVYTGAFTPPTAPLTAISGTSLLTLQSNRFKDNSTNNFAITSGGTPKVLASSPFEPATSWSASTNGGSIWFNSVTTDYLTVPITTLLDFGTSALCIEAWIYLVDTTSYASLLATSAASPGRPNFLVNSTNAQINYSGSTFFTGAVVVPVNAWTHVAFTRDTVNGGWRFFINGVLSVYLSTITQSLASGGVTQIIGLYAGSFYTNGGISNLRIINGNVPAGYQTTSTTLGTTIFAPPTTPLTPVPGTQLLLSGTNGAANDAASDSNIAISGALVSASQKKFGTGSLRFNNPGDYMRMPINQGFNFGTGNFTVEMWLYRTGPGQAANNRIFQTADGGVYAAVSISCSNTGVITAYASSNGTTWDVMNATAAGTIATGAWHHVALVRNGTVFTTYLDGTSQGTVTSSAALIYNGTYVVVGGDSAAGTTFGGYIDDLRVTKGKARYTANFTPPTAAFPTH